MIDLLFLVLLLTKIASTLLQIPKICSIHAIMEHIEMEQESSLSKLLMETNIKQTNVWTVYSANYLIGYNLNHFLENDGNLAKFFTKVLDILV